MKTIERKNLSKTPAPKADRIKGSSKNPKGSASSNESANKINLSDSIITTLENKREEYNKKHPNSKVALGTLKAVFRRGAGAYSTSHRPTISGGRPNSRSAWAFARVNKFLLKKGGTKVKKAYVQDDDLMEKGGEIVNYLIHWTNRGGLEGILNDNSFYEETSFTDSLKLPFDRDNNMSFGIRLKNVPRNLLVKQGVTELEKKHEYRTKKSLQLEKYFDGFIVRNNTNKDRLEKYLKNRANIYYNDKYFKEKVYVQKYDLMEKGAILDSSCKKYISQNESILKTGYYLNLNEFSSMIDPYGQIPLNLDYTLVTYNSGNQDGLSLIDTINSINLQNELAEILNIPFNNAQVVVGLYIKMGKKLKSISQIEGYNILVIDRDKIVCKSGKDDDLMERGGLIAPNGKKSNLSPEQYKLVRTPEFKAWFGDWERLALLKIKDSGVDEVTLDNIAKDVSKVVDENGEPLVVYHGTTKDFNIFTKNTIGENDYGFFGKGFYFGGISIAKTYSQTSDWDEINDTLNPNGRVLSCFLNVRNPLVDNAKNIIQSKETINDFTLNTIKNFDGVIAIPYQRFSPNTEYVVFEPNQIKLADGSNTTFDAENPDIRYAEGGDLGQEITCVNCGWHWNTNQSDASDKYICHRCGFDNRTFYDSDPMGEYHLGGDMSKHLAPNGKPSNLTHEQWHLVRTPEFKAWFGDWENDPKNASKVVDENGEPLVVYRGMPKKRKFGNIFKYNVNLFGKSGIGGRQTNTFAFYFTNIKEVAENYRGGVEEWAVKSYFLNVRNLFEAFSYKNQYEFTWKELYDLANKTGEPIYYLNYKGEREKVWGYDNFLEWKNHTTEWERKYEDRYPNNLPTFAFFVDWTKKDGNQYFWRNYFDKYLGYNGLVFYETSQNAVYDDEKETIVPKYEDEFSKTYAVFEPNQIKLADGSNTTFDANNPDIRYEGGGILDETYDKVLQGSINSDDGAIFLDENGIEVTDEIYDMLRNAEAESVKKSRGLQVGDIITVKGKYGNDDFKGNFRGYTNEGKLIVVYDGGKQMAISKDEYYAEGGKLKKPHNVIEIAEKHEVEVNKVIKALEKGIKKEKEHTTDYTTARTIALHHLWESPKYYDKLNKMEKELNIDEHYQDLKKIYAIGGVIDPTLSFATPSGEPSKLTYLQQVLVRTSAFKNWFGDWESSAIQFIANGRQNYDRLFKNVSKVIDKVTFEPKVVYHGTRTEKEFFIFDVSKEMGVGRPYGYFAHNIEYSQNFTTSSQRGAQNSIPILYQCFVNVKNPFYAMGNEYVDQRGDAKYWKDLISMTVTTDKYPNESDKDRLDKIKNVVVSQIGTYIDKVYENQDSPFWLLMARDENKIFKYFLNNYKYDGVFYTEEIGYPYDIDNPAQFTEAVTIFEPSQVKLADGRNLNFDPMNNDIRYEDGGKTELPQNRMENFQHSSKIEKMRNLLTNTKYAEGGEVVANKLKDGNDGKKGGYFEGRSHAEGGIKAYNKDTGQMIEVEGEEVIITKGAVKDPQKREFEGEMLTNREILSRINQSGGGVSFANGGEMESHKCGCSGKKYKYGGEMMDDYSIIKLMNQPFELISTNFESARQFADMLVEKLK